MKAGQHSIDHTDESWQDSHAYAVVSQPVQAADVGFAVLPDGRGGTNVESVVYTDAMGFDKKRSLEAFQTTVYPVLRANLPADATRASSSTR